MKKYRVDIIIFLVLISIVILIFLLMGERNTIDVQLHDTYFILGKSEIAVLVLGPLASITFLIKGLVGGFRNKITNIGLIIGLILITLIVYLILEMQQDFAKEILTFEDELLSSKETFLAEVERNMKWTWGILSLLVIGLIALVYRTIRIW